VHRCSSRTDEAAPRPLLGETPLMLRALCGSSRVREDLPRLVRAAGPFRADPANHSPAPTDTFSCAGPAACIAVDGSETSDLLEPRSPAYDSTVLLEFESINSIFESEMRFTRTRIPRAAREFSGPARRRERRLGSAWPEGLCPRGTPRRRAVLATLAATLDPLSVPGGAGGWLRGSQPTPPNDAARESAAKTDRPPRPSASGAL